MWNDEQDEVESRWFQCVIRESVLKGNRYPWNLDDLTLGFNGPTTPPSKVNIERAEDTPGSLFADLPKPFETSFKSSSSQEEYRIKPYIKRGQDETQTESIHKKLSSFSMIDER